jgi:hypothetical protein
MHGHATGNLSAMRWWTCAGRKRRGQIKSFNEQQLIEAFYSTI